MNYYIEVSLYLLQGLQTTLLIFLITILFSIPLGILLAICQRSKLFAVSKVIDFYTWLLRGTPLLLQLYFVAYGLPMLFNLPMDRMFAAYITFILNYTAYFIEIFRSGLNNVNKGQFEAGKVLGIPKYHLLRKVILPQTIQKVLPPIASETVTLVKDTALVASIAVADLLRNAKEIVSNDLRIEAYFIAGLFYLAITYLVVKLFKHLEKRLLYMR